MKTKNLIKVVICVAVLALNVGLGTTMRADGSCDDECYGNGSSNAYCGTKSGGNHIKTNTCFSANSPTHCWGVACASIGDEAEEMDVVPEY